jgi:uncharacterized protein (UPF0248 family)
MLVVHPLRNVLNRLRWSDSENAEKYLITYKHRGAPEDRKHVRACQIVRLGKSYFTLPSESDEETIIPFHRIIEVRNVETNLVIWKSRKEL